MVMVHDKELLSMPFWWMCVPHRMSLKGRQRAIVRDFLMDVCVPHRMSPKGKQRATVKAFLMDECGPQRMCLKGRQSRTF